MPTPFTLCSTEQTKQYKILLLSMRFKMLAGWRTSNPYYYWQQLRSNVEARYFWCSQHWHRKKRDSGFWRIINLLSSSWLEYERLSEPSNSYRKIEKLGNFIKILLNVLQIRLLQQLMSKFHWSSLLRSCWLMKMPFEKSILINRYRE